MLNRLLDWLRDRMVCCLACGRLFLLHTPWQEYHCNRTPLALELTDEGRQLALDQQAPHQGPVARRAAGH